MAASEEQISTVQDPNVRLFAAVSGLAAHLAPELDLAPADENEDPRDHAARLLEALQGDAATLAEQITAIGEEVTHLRRSLAGHKGMSKRLRNEIGVLESIVNKKPREFTAPEAAMPGPDLLELIDCAETVELVLVDPDGRELALAPREIIGGAGAWFAGVNGLRLNVAELKVSGPEQGAPAYPLGGYALVLDGELAALQLRPQISIGAGMTHELKDDVLFEIAEVAAA